MSISKKGKIPEQTLVWQKCPICNGTGLVGSGFYLSALGGAGVSDHSTETCQQCKGNGILVAPYKPEPLARPCDTCGTNVSQAIDHDSVECFETCKEYSLWAKERK